MWLASFLTAVDFAYQNSLPSSPEWWSVNSILAFLHDHFQKYLYEVQVSYLDIYRRLSLEQQKGSLVEEGSGSLPVLEAELLFQGAWGQRSEVIIPAPTPHPCDAVDVIHLCGPPPYFPRSALQFLAFSPSVPHICVSSVLFGLFCWGCLLGQPPPSCSCQGLHPGSHTRMPFQKWD